MRPDADADRSSTDAGQRDQSFTRRDLLKGAGATGLAVAGGTLLGPGGTALAATRKPPKPKRGGHVVFGLGGGGNTVVPDPNYPASVAASLLVEVIWDQLTQVNNQFELQMWLAESVEPNKSLTEWTIRLRPDILFQNGKPCTADDVIYTLQRILNPKNAFYGLSQLYPANRNAIRKLDKRTVRVGMLRPNAVFDYALGDGGLIGIVPVGFSRKNPIGTGAFRVTQFAPDQLWQLERNPHYWRNSAQPYLDSIDCHIIDSDTARVNALLTGSVDAISQVPFAQAPIVKARSNLRLLESRNGAAIYYGMNVNYSPWKDVRVRQAFKYALNRPQIVQDAVSGHGFAGNDVFAPFDPDFDHSLVRRQDLAKARHLLKQARQTGVKAQMVVGAVAPGAVQAATVMANNANQAGFNLSVRNVPYGTIAGTNFMRWPFTLDQLPGLTYLTSVSLASIKNASIGISHWNNTRFNKLYNQAVTTRKVALRKEIIREMQVIEFNQGANLVPFFANTIDAYSNRIAGWPSEDLTGTGLGRGRWDQIYLT